MSGPGSELHRYKSSPDSLRGAQYEHYPQEETAQRAGRRHGRDLNLGVSDYNIHHSNISNFI